MQSQFVMRPFVTWQRLHTALNPYLQKLPAGSRFFYDKKIQEITCLFRDEDKAHMNEALKPDYLLGYYLQREDLYKKKDAADDADQNEDQED